MGTHPLNLAFRFLLEFAALWAMGLWGWRFGAGGWGIVLAGGLPLLAALVWGVFAVPGDPSRGKDGLVAVAGTIRILIEAAFFGFATWAFYDAGEMGPAIGLGIAVIVHYGLSLDRLNWLRKQ